MQASRGQRYVLVVTAAALFAFPPPAARAAGSDDPAPSAGEQQIEAERQIEAEQEPDVPVDAVARPIGSLSGSVALLTDYVYRGVSQTLEEPALQGELRYTHDVGFYLGAWASNIDFVEATGPDDGADIEIDWVAGISRPVGENASWGAGLTYYHYPGIAHGIHYDFLELNLSYGYRWLTFGLNVSDDVVASGETGVDYVVSGAFPLGGRFTLGAAIGHWDLDDALGDSYTRWEARLAYDFSHAVLSLAYYDTDSSGEALFGENASERVVVGLSRSF